MPSPGLRPPRRSHQAKATRPKPPGSSSMTAKDDKDEGAGSRIGALPQISQDLVQAALTGASDSGLLALLGTALTTAGLDLSMIEGACDVVDSERALHVIRWPRSIADTAGGILATGVFRAMLEQEITVLRPD